MSTELTVGTSESDIYTVVRALILAVIPQIEVIKARQNLVAQPKGRHIVLTPLRMKRLATNIENQDLNVLETLWKGQMTIQADCYGNNAMQDAIVLSTVFRGSIGCDNMPANIQPLYAGEPKNMEFVNDGKNFENRWMVELNFQVNVTISAIVEYFNIADISTIGIYEVK